MSTSHRVIYSDFAQKHYIKDFVKKYSEKSWKSTEKAITAQLTRFDVLVSNCPNYIEIIRASDLYKVYKLDFRVAGTQESKKTSGNRAIICEEIKSKVVYVLLVYNKTHIKGSHETVWWQGVIQENYPEFCFEWR